MNYKYIKYELCYKECNDTRIFIKVFRGAVD